MFLVVLTLLVLMIAVLICLNKDKKVKEESQPSAQEVLSDTQVVTVVGAQEQGMPEEENAQKLLDRFAFVNVGFKESDVPEEKLGWVKKTLPYLVKAADLMDEIFLIQVSPKNPMWRRQLSEGRFPVEHPLLSLFDLMYGPWDRLEEDKPFYDDKQKPLGAGFYPPDMTKGEFESWVKEHPKDEEKFRSYFTVIIRDNTRNLFAVPYSTFYYEQLPKAAKFLELAALEVRVGVGDASLRRYLDSRAKALLSNDYRESDAAWLDISKESPLDVVIGPYEVYEDKLFGYKAAFETFILIVNPADTQELDKFISFMPELKKNLPLAEKDKEFELKKLPLVVANLIYSTGDTHAGIPTVAFSLPNDDFTRKTKGSKQVMMKNMGKAKFENCGWPIAKRVLSLDQLGFVNFETYWLFVLMHELSHALRPPEITVNGKKTAIDQMLKEYFSVIEECRAETLAVRNLAYLVEKGKLPNFTKENFYTISLSAVFRSVRFGINEAHAQAVLLYFNFLKERGAYSYQPADGRFQVNYEKIGPALEELVALLHKIEVEGNYEGAKKLIENYVKVPEEMAEKLKQMKDIPNDIYPIYMLKEQLRKEGLW